MSSSAVGSISLNQSFINTATAASFRKTHGVAPLLVSNSVDSPLTRDSSPPTMNHSFQTHSDQQFNSNQNFSTGMPINPTVASIRSLRKPLNRTQSAPLSFGYPILPNVVNATNQGNNSPQAKQSPNNSSIITKNNLPNGPIDTEFVKQRVRQTVLTRSANRQQKQPLLQNKFKQQKHHSFSLDEEPSDEKNKSFDKNVDSGSGSFDECYIENMPKSEYDLKLENEALLQFQQQQLIQNLQQGIGSFNYEAQLSQLSPSEQLLYQQLILQQQQQLLLLFQQQQANSNIYSKNHDQVPINDLPGLSSLNISDEMSNNYNQYTQAFLDRFNLSNNLLKRASSTPVVQLVSPLINQNKVSYSSLVGTFSHLNLSQNNLSMISSTSNPGSPDPIDQNSTAIVTDESMLRHDCTCGNPNNHLENPTRLLAIFKRLFITGLSSKCCYLPARKATIEELESVHGSTYCQLFAVDSQSRQKLDASQIDKLPIKSYVKMNCGGVGVDSDTVWNESLTASAVRFAAGCVIDLAILVAKNKLKNGFAIVRPPGHHAEYQQPMGFCYFNSVAVAAQQLKLKLGLKRILILDWDVHHGNGTQKQFYDDDKVLYMSLHRHDQGNFFPGTGDVTECGIAGSSLGKTINIAWYGSVNLYGDAEYLAAFRSIVLPVIQEWKPEMVLVSCGFDAAEGHLPQLGGYHLSPAMFGWMTNEVLKLTNGKIVLALEGGYELSSICSSTEQVVKALLNLPLESISETELSRRPNLMAVETLTKVYKIQSKFF
ncbi:hypothetical protein RND71_044128 [Anisodus tanguticus]|uniref:histone deacetylase n=1 Tax=Anisodus tanguticus TaxID=243964 RepID=A0AAE1QS00_9SOLA|nr:hypothetical protein RND71_044128 [Anisodus tanguticus]